MVGQIAGGLGGLGRGPDRAWPTRRSRSWNIPPSWRPSRRSWTAPPDSCARPTQKLTAALDPEGCLPEPDQPRAAHADDLDPRVLRDPAGGRADRGRERTRYAGIIHDEAIRLTRLLDDLLDLSVLENGQVTLTAPAGAAGRADRPGHRGPGAMTEVAASGGLEVLREPGRRAARPRDRSPTG